MHTPIKSKPIACVILILLQLLLGVGAVFGGAALIIDPSGIMIQIPLYLLENSPFSNFLVPGIMLLVVLGVIPLIIASSLITGWNSKFLEALNIFKDVLWSWTFSIYIGYAVIIWITIQVYIINGAGIVHIFYVFLAIAIQIFTLLPKVRNYYQKSPS